MGNANIKFRNALVRGDSRQALEIWQSERKLRQKLDVNTTYGKKYNNNTPVHLCCRYSMLEMLALLLERGGDPNLSNDDGETCLHLLCSSRDNESRRLECLTLLLRHRANKLRLNSADNRGNTPLHRAAGAGLEQLVEILLHQNVVSTLTNTNGRTAAEEASHYEHNSIGHRIEAHILFDTSDDDMLAQLHGLQAQDVATLAHRLMCSSSEKNGTTSHVGLNITQLRAEKDRILVYVSEMLQLPHVLAETLLRHGEWDHRNVLERFQLRPLDVFRDAGIDRMTIAAANDAALQVPNSSNTNSMRKEEVEETERECLICMSAGVCAPVSSFIHGAFVPRIHTIGRGERESSTALITPPLDLFSGDNVPLIPSSGCSHLFCADCWSSYLTLHIQDANTEGIRCPSHADGCVALVPSNYIDALVSKDLAQKHQKFDLDAFVSSNPDLRWCPRAGCGRVVQRVEDCNQIRREHMMVDCGNGHMWCFSCAKAPHEPCTCKEWNVWFGHVKLLTGRDITQLLDGLEQKCGKRGSSTDIADQLWLAANTKPCPKCKTPISKGDGCHHMTCRVCTHEWCWLCGDLWSKHSKASGGFYSCNRFRGNGVLPQDPVVSVDGSDSVNAPGSGGGGSRRGQERRRGQQPPAGTAGVKNTESIAAIRRRGLAMEKFLHYYSRFEAHVSSFHLERRYLNTTKQRRQQLSKASHQETKSAGMEEIGFEWLHQAILELVKNRMVLSASYAFACFEFGGATKELVEVDVVTAATNSSHDETKEPSSSLSSSSSSMSKEAAKLGFLTEKARKTMIALEQIMGESLSKRNKITQEQQLFEMQQADLEMVTEQLSEMVARKHLRVTRQRILQTALEARRDRQIFTTSCSNGMIPEQQYVQPSRLSRKIIGDRGRKRRSSKKSSRGSSRSNGSDREESEGRVSLPAPPAPSVRMRSLSAPTPPAHWQCPTCTLINSPDTTRCSCCDTLRNQTGNASAVNDASSLQAQLFQLVQQEESNNPNWQCHSCTFNNEGYRSRCHVCHTPKTLGTSETKNANLDETDVARDATNVSNERSEEIQEAEDETNDGGGEIDMEEIQELLVAEDLTNDGGEREEIRDAVDAMNLIESDDVQELDATNVDAEQPENVQQEVPH